MSDMLPWCDLTPDPLYIALAFLLSGLVQTHSDACAVGDGAQMLRLCACSLCADCVSYSLFSFGIRDSPDASGALGAGVLSVLIAMPIRGAAASLYA